MNRSWTGQGPSCANLHQWGLAQQNLKVDRIYSMLLMWSSNPHGKKCLFGEGSSTWVCPCLHLVIILSVVHKGAAVMRAVYCTVYFIMCAKFVIDRPFHSTCVVIVILSTRCCKNLLIIWNADHFRNHFVNQNLAVNLKWCKNSRL